MTALRNSRNQIDGHFSFGCFYGCVSLSGGHGISFREDLWRDEWKRVLVRKGGGAKREKP